MEDCLLESSSPLDFYVKHRGIADLPPHASENRILVDALIPSAGSIAICVCSSRRARVWGLEPLLRMMLKSGPACEKNDRFAA